MTSTRDVQRLANVGGHQIDARDVQPHHLGGQAHRVGHLGMDLIGAFKRHVAVALHQHPLARRRHAVGLQSLALQQQAHGWLAVQADGLQRKFFGLAPARIGVELLVDQRLHRMETVAGDPQAFAARRRHHPAAHHQHPVLVAGDEAFNDDLAALGIGHTKSLFDIGLFAQLQRHAPAVVGVRRFHHHRQTDVLCGLPRVGGVVHHPAFGHRHTSGLQQAFGQVFVAGDVFGDGAGEVGLGGPDTALTRAVTELHQVAVVEPQVRNAALGGGRHNRRRRWAKPGVVDHLAQLMHRRVHIKRFVIDRCLQQRVAVAQRGFGGGGVAGPKHHAIDARLAGAAGLTKAGGHARAVEQLNDAVLQDVPRPSAFAQALNEAASLAHTAVVLLERRQPRQQTLGQPGQGVGGPLLQLS